MLTQLSNTTLWKPVFCTRVGVWQEWDQPSESVWRYATIAAYLLIIVACVLLGGMITVGFQRKKHDLFRKLMAPEKSRAHMGLKERVGALYELVSYQGPYYAWKNALFLYVSAFVWGQKVVLLSLSGIGPGILITLTLVVTMYTGVGNIVLTLENDMRRRALFARLKMATAIVLLCFPPVACVSDGLMAWTYEEQWQWLRGTQSLVTATGRTNGGALVEGTHANWGNSSWGKEGVAWNLDRRAHLRSAFYSAIADNVWDCATALMPPMSILLLIRLLYTKWIMTGIVDTIHESEHMFDTVARRAKRAETQQRLEAGTAGTGGGGGAKMAEEFPPGHGEGGVGGGGGPTQSSSKRTVMGLGSFLRSSKEADHADDADSAAVRKGTGSARWGAALGAVRKKRTALGALQALPDVTYVRMLFMLPIKKRAEFEERHINTDARRALMAAMRPRPVPRPIAAVGLAVSVGQLLWILVATMSGLTDSESGGFGTCPKDHAVWRYCTRRAYPVVWSNTIVDGSGINGAWNLDTGCPCVTFSLDEAIKGVDVCPRNSSDELLQGLLRTPTLQVLSITANRGNSSSRLCTWDSLHAKQGWDSLEDINGGLHTLRLAGNIRFIENGTLKRLYRLTTLVLNNNQLLDLPRDMEGMNINNLKLSQNSFQTVPAVIKSFANLYTLVSVWAREKRERERERDLPK
jgi:hypothetical protein